MKRRDEEYRRLLYVAMTRAEDRLYLCGWRTKRPSPSQCWYDLAASGIAAIAAPEPFDFAAVLGEDGWAGTGYRHDRPQQGGVKVDARDAAGPVAAAELPRWAGTLPPPEPAPPRPLAPSRPALAEPAARSPLGLLAGTRDGLGFKRGLIIHRLLQILPELDPARRRKAAEQFLARPVHGLAAAEQAAIAEEILAILAAPDFAALFGPESQAEVPIVGLIGDYAIAGQIDRLVVMEDEILIVDYKTLRPKPASDDEVPPAYLRQLAAYRAAIAQIYPGRAVTCALLWTDGPLLMPISPALLDRWAP